MQELCVSFFKYLYLLKKRINKLTNCFLNNNININNKINGKFSDLNTCFQEK